MIGWKTTVIWPSAIACSSSVPSCSRLRLCWGRGPGGSLATPPEDGAASSATSARCINVPASVPCTGAAATPMVRTVTSRSRPATQGARGRRPRAGDGRRAPSPPVEEDPGSSTANCSPSMRGPGQRVRRCVLAQEPSGRERELVTGGVPERVGDLGVVARRRPRMRPGAGADRVERTAPGRSRPQAATVGRPDALSGGRRRRGSG